MVIDSAYIEHSDGAKFIVEYCEDLGDELCLEFIKTPYWVLPVVDAISIKKHSNLIIETTVGSTKVTISREELDNYPEKISSEGVKGKIRRALHGLLAKS